MAADKKPQRLNLKGGAKLRFEITRMADNRLLLKQIAVLQQGGRTIETEYWRKECSTEEEMWATLIELGSQRLCALSEITP